MSDEKKKKKYKKMRSWNTTEQPPNPVNRANPK